MGRVGHVIESPNIKTVSKRLESKRFLIYMGKNPDTVEPELFLVPFLLL